MLRGLEGWHFIVLALVFILLFGAKKLPESARSCGASQCARWLRGPVCLARRRIVFPFAAHDAARRLADCSR